VRGTAGKRGPTAAMVSLGRGVAPREHAE